MRARQFTADIWTKELIGRFGRRQTQCWAENRKGNTKSRCEAFTARICGEHIFVSRRTEIRSAATGAVSVARTKIKRNTGSNSTDENIRSFNSTGGFLQPKLKDLNNTHQHINFTGWQPGLRGGVCFCFLTICAWLPSRDRFQAPHAPALCVVPLLRKDMATLLFALRTSWWDCPRGR